MSDPRNIRVTGKTHEIPNDVKIQIRQQLIDLIDDGIANDNPFVFAHLNSKECCVILGGASTIHIVEMVRAIMAKTIDGEDA